MSYSVGHRHGSALMLLWLWHRLAAKAPIQPLAWEPPYAVGAALKSQKEKKEKKKKREKKKKSLRELASKPTLTTCPCFLSLTELSRNVRLLFPWL